MKLPRNLVWAVWFVVMAGGCAEEPEPAPRYEWTTDKYGTATRLKGGPGWGMLDFRVSEPGLVGVKGSGIVHVTEVRLGAARLTVGDRSDLEAEVPLPVDLGALGLDLFDGTAPDLPVELPLAVTVRGERTAPFETSLRVTRTDAALVVQAGLVAVTEGTPLTFADEPARPRTLVRAHADPTYGWVVAVVGDITAGQRVADVAWVALTDTKVVGRRQCGRYRSRDGRDTRDVELTIEAARARVFDRRTGALIAERSFAPKRPRCEATVALFDGQSSYARGSGDDQLTAWLEAFPARQK